DDFIPTPIETFPCKIVAVLRESFQTVMSKFDTGSVFHFKKLKRNERIAGMTLILPTVLQFLLRYDIGNRAAMGILRSLVSLARERETEADLRFEIIQLKIPLLQLGFGSNGLPYPIYCRIERF